MQYSPNRRSVLQFAAAYGLISVSPAFAARPKPQFNIFFDFESTEMTAAASEVAEALAREILPSARVTLAGNADTAEARPDRLSYARGNEVLKYFLRKPSLVKVRFNVVINGISAPLVRTGPNIKEPQNRRVEVKIE
jgi:outer membrane protein OmpA-like peptidoglycan-associated protein